MGLNQNSVRSLAKVSASTSEPSLQPLCAVFIIYFYSYFLELLGELLGEIGTVRRNRDQVLMLLMYQNPVVGR